MEQKVTIDMSIKFETYNKNGRTIGYIDKDYLEKLFSENFDVDEFVIEPSDDDIKDDEIEHLKEEIKNIIQDRDDNYRRLSDEELL